MENELIIKWVVEIVCELCGEYDESKVLNSNNILEELVMDSLLFMEMITKIEKRYSIMVPDELLRMESFSSVYKITDIIVALIDGSEH